MNAVRRQRRWLAERLVLLFPAFFAGLAVVLGMGLRDDLRPSFKLFALAVSLLLNAVLAYFLVLTALCGRLHSLGRCREARLIRRALLHVRGVSAGALLLLAVLGATPLLFRERTAPSRVFQPRFVLHEAPSVAAPPAAPEAAAPDPVKREEVAGSPPVLLDILASLPRCLGDDQSGGEFFPQDPLPAPLAGGGGADDEDNRSFTFDFAGFRLRLTIPDGPAVDRPYLPDGTAPEGSYPGSVRLDAAYLKEHEGRNAGAFALQIDLATQKDASLRFTYLLAALAQRDAEGFESGVDLTFAHTTLEYVLRLAGHTRHAPFDLSVSAGLSVDVLHPVSGSDVDGRARVSPYLAVDAAFWQSGSLGLLLHAGQSIPVNLTGGSSGSSDFSALLRLDLTPQVSVHLGYRILVIRAHDYERSLSGEGDQDFDSTLSGPLMGLEVRF